jgi:hypothetical protein
VGRAVEAEETAPLEDAVDDGDGEVLVVQDLAPGVEGLVGGEDHRAPLEVALVDDVVEDVGRLVAVGQVANFVDHEDVRVGVARDCLAEAALAAGDGELLDERGGGDEEGVEAVLDGPVGDGDGEVGLPAAGLAVEDERAPLGDEVGREVGADEGEPDRGLVGEVEVVDGLEEGETGIPGGLLESGLLAVGDLLGEEDAEEVLVGPLLLLGTGAEVAPDAAGVGQVEALEGGVEVGRGHWSSLPVRKEGVPEVWPGSGASLLGQARASLFARE